MQEIWTKIEGWYKKNTSEKEIFNAGASEAEIKDLESFLGIEFPSDVRDSYSIHNGQKDFHIGFIDSFMLLPLDQIKEDWVIWKELYDTDDDPNVGSPSRGVCPYWWHPRWIPLTSDGSGNFHCLDLIPAKGGQEGQIITMWHDEDTRKLLAKSFRLWLQKFADELESGIYMVGEYGLTKTNKKRSKKLLFNM
jgi:cell wall assembly regulator SMI1